MQNWIWTYFLVRCSGNVGDRRLARLAEALHEHGAFLHSNLEHHWPNNHLLLEAKALSEYARLFPESAKSREFLQRATQVLNREVLAQVLPDGGHAELCSMYHRIVAGELAELVALSERMGKRLSAPLEERISAMAEFSRALLREDGTMPLLGDSALTDNYMRFDLALRQKSDLNYWVWPEKGRAPLVVASGNSVKLDVFQDAGYAFLRGGTGDSAFHLTFDYGPFSRCACANHGHADALSFELYSGGRVLIGDPGAYFPCRDGDRWTRYFRSPAAHNTLVVDGREPSELCDYSDARRRARTRLLDRRVSADFAVVSAESVPHWGNGIRHIREIRACAKGSLTVRDQVTGSGRHRLEWFFHFGAGLEAVESAAGTVVLREPESGVDLLRLRPVTTTPPP